LECCKKIDLKCAVSDVESKYSDVTVLEPVMSMVSGLMVIGDKEAVEELKKRTISMPGGEKAKEVVAFIRANTTLQAEIVAQLEVGMKMEKRLERQSAMFASYERCVGGGCVGGGVI